MANIVIIEDEPDIADVIAHNLQREGYDVETAHRGDDGLRLVQDSRPDLVILDVMLPGMPGYEVCQKIRVEPAIRETLIFMISAKGEEADVVIGLGVGADDYMAKPFGTRELVARVQTLLRRLRDQPNAIGHDTDLRFTDLTIDPVSHVVLVREQPVHFTATEFRILYHAAAQPGRVFTRAQLQASAHRDGSTGIERNIDVHVRAIRKKLGNCCCMIETVRGVGYRFVEA